MAPQSEILGLSLATCCWPAAADRVGPAGAAALAQARRGRGGQPLLHPRVLHGGKPARLVGAGAGAGAFPAALGARDRAGSRPRQSRRDPSLAGGAGRREPAERRAASLSAAILPAAGAPRRRCPHGDRQGPPAGRPSGGTRRHRHRPGAGGKRGRRARHRPCRRRSVRRRAVRPGLSRRPVEIGRSGAAAGAGPAGEGRSGAAAGSAALSAKRARARRCPPEPVPLSA